MDSLRITRERPAPLAELELIAELELGLKGAAWVEDEGRRLQGLIDEMPLDAQAQAIADEIACDLENMEPGSPPHTAWARDLEALRAREDLSGITDLIKGEPLTPRLPGEAEGSAGGL